MIEVEPHGNGWLWRMISEEGRTLVERTGYPTDWDAITCAKDYRVRFWRVACKVDHRMGACV